MNKKVIIFFVSLFLLSYSVNALEWSSTNIWNFNQSPLIMSWVQAQGYLTSVTSGIQSYANIAMTNQSNTFAENITMNKGLNVNNQFFVDGVNGKVGIGTPTPKALLEIYNTSSLGTSPYINISTKGVRRPFFYVGGSGSVMIGTEPFIYEDLYRVYIEGRAKNDYTLGVIKSWDSTKASSIQATADITFTYSTSTDGISPDMRPLNFGFSQSGTGRNTGGIVYGNKLLLSNTGNGSLGTYRGFQASITQTGGGNITTAQVIYVPSYPSQNGTIDNLYGLYIGDLGNQSRKGYGIYLENQTQGAGNTERYAIYSVDGDSYIGGRIGIGTKSPSGALTIHNVSSLNANSYLNISSKGVAAPFVYVDGRGHMGVGMVPSYRLDVNGDIRGAGDLWLSTGSPRLIANSNLRIYTDATGTTERMRIDSNGNVGIGTSAPDVALHIKSLVDGSTEVKMDGTGLTGGNQWTIGTGYSGEGLNISNFYWYDNTAPNAGVKMVLTPKGNLGVGAMMPNQLLTIYNVSATTGGYLNISSAGVVNPFLFVDRSGKVGIGTASPNQKLVVQDSAGIVANFTTATGQANVSLKSPNGKEWNCGVNDAGAFQCN